MSALDVAPQVTGPELAEDDPILSHIVGPQDDLTGAERVMRARVFGTPVEALCGHLWVPSRDPERHPVCQRCADVLAAT